MSEWWTYRLSDLLLFAPKTYYRLFELYNGEVWPLQIVALALGLVILVLLLRDRTKRQKRIVAAIVAVLWLWVAGAFHLKHYATINWAAIWFAAGFAAEALMLLAPRVIKDEQKGTRFGVALFVFALLVQPLLGPIFGRPWTQIELFGMMPDPTALGTIGIGLALGTPRWLLIVPLLWCAISGATLWAMGAPDALLVPLVAGGGLVVAMWRRAERR